MSRPNRRYAAANSGVGIDPSTLPGWELSYRSDTVVGANLSGAGTWTDGSGNVGRNATQATGANQPTITDGASPNGKRMLFFDGVDDQMSNTLPALPTGIPNTDGYTIYLYFQEGSLTTGGFNSQLLIGGPLEMVARTAVIGGYSADQKYGLAFNRQVLGNTALGFQTFTGVWTPGGSPIMQGFVNGVQSGVDLVWNAATLGNGITIGSNAGAVVSLQGFYGSIDIFSHAHSLTVRAGVEAFIKNYFEG